MIRLIFASRCDPATFQQLKKVQNKCTNPVTQNEITETIDLKFVRAIFTMVSSKQYPTMFDETANFPKKKQLTLFKQMWIMTAGLYRAHEITQCGEVVVMVNLKYFIQF